MHANISGRTETTANLIIHMLSVERKWIRPLPMDVPTEIPDTGGVKVTLIEANHCLHTPRFIVNTKKTETLAQVRGRVFFFSKAHRP